MVKRLRELRSHMASVRVRLSYGGCQGEDTEGLRRGLVWVEQG